MAKELPVLILEFIEQKVSSWSPGEADEHVPATEVHILEKLDGLDFTFIKRYKSRAALQQFIDALVENRDFVWPEE